MKLVAIGTTEFIPGFALAGVQTKLATAENVLESIKSQADAGIIILDEKLTNKLSAAQREELETSVNPVIITLGPTNQQERLRRSVMGTLGVDLFK